MKQGLLAFLKVIVFLLFLPLILAVSLAFQTHLLNLPASKEAWLLWGAFTYIIANFFIYDCKDIFLWGKELTSKIFGFVGPLANAVSLMVPIYSVTIIIVYVILTLMGKASFYDGLFLFSIGFTLTMNLVLAAGQLKGEDSGPLKAQYFLGFTLLYVFSLCFMALLLSWVMPEFSFIAFIKSLTYHATHLYKEVYRLLFIG